MKLKITSLGSEPPDVVDRNEAHALTRGLPRYKGSAAATSLAVVGGGPSIADHVETLKAWAGDIWAINGAFHWCRDRGIEATLFSVDPSPKLLPYVLGAGRAILALGCHPDVFDALSGADVETVKFSAPDGLPSGPTSATCAPYVAIRGGYREVTFFGCESSFVGTTHAYGDARRLDDLMQVRCNGMVFLTSPDMMMQVEIMTEMIRAAPHVFREQSGGLLRACVKAPDIDVVKVTRKLMETLSA